MGDQWPAVRRYEPLEEIGVGAYGIVYRARDLENDNRIVALKRLRVQASEEGMPLATVREIALLKQLERFDHPNIVRLLDVCCGRRTAREIRLMLVFEHVDYDLEAFMNQRVNNERVPVSVENCRNISRQLLSGLDFLHSHQVVHRDLKPQNVLISRDNMQVRIADFGLARLYSADSSLTQVVVTLWYRAPEVLLHRSYHSAVDLWGCGCILAELFNGEALFRGDGEIAQLREIFQKRGLPSLEEWPSDTAITRSSFPPTPKRDMSEVCPRAPAPARELLERLLEFKYESRINAANSLQCSWFVNPPNVEGGQPQEPPMPPANRTHRRPSQVVA